MPTAAAAGMGETVHHLRGRRCRVEAVGAPGSVPARVRRVAARRVPARRGVGNGVAAARRTRHHEHVLKREDNLITTLARAG